MNRLKGTTVYLAGPVECAKDCTSWRTAISKKLKDIEIIPWDPLAKPKWFKHKLGDITVQDQIDDKFILNKFLNDDIMDSNTIKSINRNKNLREICLRLASACDFMICFVSGQTVGTFEEICIANQQKKPILFFTEDKPLDSCWRAAQFKLSKNKFFTSMDHLLDYINDINYGHTEVNKIDWIFLDGMWNEN